MHGNTVTRVGRLVSNLLTHPNYLMRYLQQGPLTKRGPLDHEVPWFSFAAIDFLKSYLRPEMTVFEYGSGGSTLFFAKRVAHVVTTEDHPEWFAIVEQRLKQKGIENVTLQLRPFEFESTAAFEASDYVKSIPEEKFDVLVVDGTEHGHDTRPVCFRHAESFVKPGGIIVVDDSWRYDNLGATAGSTRHQRFQSVGPCRPGVTSTDVYFY